MITQVRVKNFKVFSEQIFNLGGHVVLAGPNNSGKTTLLQAIAMWDMALQRWKAERSDEKTSKAKQRVGVPITRKDFTAIPLRQLKNLWTNESTALRRDELKGKQKPGHPRVLEIAVSGKDLDNANWELAFEFHYHNRELIYAKPPITQIGQLPKDASGISVVHVPPFSGIGVEETRYDRPYQDLLIGQGKPGDILRNLLLEVFQKTDKSDWNDLCRRVEEIFGYRLIPPEYEGRPFIVCEYIKGIPKGKGKDGLPVLDISSAGSGFHQVLILLGFFYARPASILLLDEPDAHLHVILQRQIYNQLQSIAAERRCQLVVATHSEVLIEDTSPDRILSFYSAPRVLIADTERDQVREALKRLTAMDILLADGAKGVLYLEGETDFNLLQSWARILGHPAHEFFSKMPFWHNNQGRNPAEARGHFFALRAVKPGIPGYLLLDGDNRNLPDREISANGLVISRWRRYEAENYLIHPALLTRFIESKKGGPLFASASEKFLREVLLPGEIFSNPLGVHDYLNNTSASKSILPRFFQNASLDIRKNEYYQVADQMLPEEISDDVKFKLDEIVNTFRIGSSKG
jgi:predicted ATPase